MTQISEQTATGQMNATSPHPDLHQLRQWQRSLEPERVISALGDLDDSSLQPQSVAVYALAQAALGTDESQKILQDVAGQEPSDNDPLWMSDIGLACFLVGNLEKADTLLQKASLHSEATAVEYGRLAAVYLNKGELEQARIHYQEAVDREPGHAVWHSNLAGILVRQQRYEEALEQYETALRIDSDLVQAQNGRTSVLLALQRSGELADELYSKLEKNPDSLEIRLQLARLLDLDNQFSEAIRVLRESLCPVEDVIPPDKELSLEEKKTTIWWEQIALRAELAKLFKQRNRIGFALQAFQQVEQLQPENPIFCLVGQAECYSEMGQYEDAHQRLDEAEAFLKQMRDTPETDSASAEASSDSQSSETPVNFLNIDLIRSRIYSESGNYQEAEKLLRDLLETYPGHGGLLSQLGQTLLWTGKLDEAADFFERAAKINPMALAQMVNARRMPEDEESINVMIQVADNPLYIPAVRSNMSYALASLFEKRNEFENAWHYLDLANSLINKRLQYDPKRFSRRVDDFCLFFSSSFLFEQEPIRKSDRTPIFVVGMPRSGTTLVEQILASHPSIFGAGELDIIPRLVNRLIPRVLESSEPYPFCLESFTPHLREEAARHYLYRLDLYDTEHPCVVDKMPHNFMHLGLISLIFPKAKIIHVQRDPLDTAISSYQQNFRARHGGLGYAFDLEKTAMQLNDYHRMMKHWRRVLPIPMFELPYEDLVTDQATWSRKLIEFIGLDWNDSILEFYKTERPVRTASVSQVRQPIYKTSKQKWRYYEKHLGLLFDNLSPEVIHTYQNDMN